MTDVVALDSVSLTVEQGEIVGLLGPNGAGKTTLLKILCTVLLPSSGNAQVLGLNVVSQAQRVREHLGIVFGGERGLYGRLTVRDNLDYWSAMYRVPRRRRSTRVPELIEMVGLTEQTNTPVDRLSRGMKQRLHLARGLVNDPDLVILDEPTSGLDPVGARQFRVLLDGLRQAGRTILIATHDMAEAEELCDRIVLIDHGRILGIEDPKTIGRLLAPHERVEAQGVSENVLAQIATLSGAGEPEDIGEGWLRIQTDRDETTASVLKLLVDSGHTSLRTTLPSLEEVYMHLIGDRGLTV